MFRVDLLVYVLRPGEATPWVERYYWDGGPDLEVPISEERDRRAMRAVYDRSAGHYLALLPPRAY